LKIADYLDRVSIQSLMDNVKGDDRNQSQFNSLDDLVPQASWARVVDLFVDILSIKALVFKNTQLIMQGREPFEPAEV
jgi:hypothetical protein